MNTYATKANVRYVEDASGTVIADLDTGTYFGLNGVGVVVWHELVSRTPVTEIVRQVADRFHTSTDVVADDVQRFVTELHAAGLLIAIS